MKIRESVARGFLRVAQAIGLPKARPRATGAWDATSTDRLYEDWQAWSASPEFETRYDFKFARARARWMARNNPWIVGFLDELANNVVGPNGIQLQARIRDLLGKLDKQANFIIEAAWDEWCFPENASADGHDSFTELLRQIIQTIAVDGECFLRRIRGTDNSFGYTLQIIDADLVDETFNVPAGPNRNRIRMGVEVDRRNRPIAYYVWTRYAEDMTGEERKRERIPAEDMLHLFVRWHRSNIPRGITWLAPVLTRLRHEGEYEINHLVASRAGASKMAFILNKHPEAVSGFEPPKKGEKPRVFEMQPGAIPELLPGQEIAEFDPTFPSVAYEQYVMAVLRAVARGLKVSYMTLTGDLRQANYGSQRAGLLPERDRWRGLQVWLAIHGVRIIYRDWIDMAALKGAVKLASRLGSDFYAVLFHGRGWKWIDPKNDLEAAKLEIELGLNSRTRLNAERGYDYEEIVDELSDEEDYADGKGVDVSGNQARAAGLAPRAPNTSTDEKPDDDESGSGTGARQLAAVG